VTAATANAGIHSTLHVLTIDCIRTARYPAKRRRTTTVSPSTRTIHFSNNDDTVWATPPRSAW
jgi:hypothetical protein